MRGADGERMSGEEAADASATVVAVLKLAWIHQPAAVYQMGCVRPGDHAFSWRIMYTSMRGCILFLCVVTRVTSGSCGRPILLVVYVLACASVIQMGFFWNCTVGGHGMTSTQCPALDAVQNGLFADGLGLVKALRIARTLRIVERSRSAHCTALE